MDARKVYRGTGAAILGECQQMGLQFLFTGMTKKLIANQSDGSMSPTTEFAAAAAGGLLSSFFTTPVELVMIQQQKFGGSLVGTGRTIVKTHGFSGNGVMRGLLGAASRDSIYVAGMLGVTPILRDYIMKNSNTSSGVASLYASLLGGVVAAVPSHPFDVIKTCMQGDMHRTTYGSFSETARTLYASGGIRRMFSGCMWRTVNVTATVYVANECRIRMSPFLSTVQI